MKKKLNLITYILIGIAIICSIFLTIQRINIEEDYKQVELIVNMTELESLANANDLEIKELTQMLKEKGVTGVLVKELSLGDLARTGQVSFYQGQEIKLSPYYSKLPQNIPLNNAEVIVVIHNKELENQIVTHLKNKLAGIEIYPGNLTAITVPVNMPNSDLEKKKIYEDLKSIGVGFDISKLKELTYLDLMIIPQIRDWPDPTDESLKFITKEIKKLPNISFIMFNDENVPGYPDKIKTFSTLLKNEEGLPYAPIGIVEFFNQKGITNLATSLNKETVRVHSISLNEMRTYTRDKAIDRFELAVKERNIRVLFVRFFKMDQPATALETNLEYIEKLTGALEKHGFIFGKVEQFNSPLYSQILIALIGIGVIAGGVLILNKKDWVLLSLILGLLGVIGWIGLLFISPILARKLMALASVIVFPALAFLVIIREEKRTLLQSIIALLKLSAVSLIGALLMIGLLADKLFMLKLDQFVGVKAAHIIPLLIIPILVFALEEKPIEKIKTLFNKPVNYKVTLLAGIGLIVLAIYVIRTGNVSAEFVSGFEQQLRQFLQEVLRVRPRTKEFLIGHPFTLVILYYGLKKEYWYLLLPAIIGQVSLVNTYAHIHTPVLISLLRSFNGLWLGIIIGIGLISLFTIAKKILSDVIAKK